MFEDIGAIGSDSNSFLNVTNSFLNVAKSERKSRISLFFLSKSGGELFLFDFGDNSFLSSEISYCNVLMLLLISDRLDGDEIGGCLTYSGA